MSPVDRVESTWADVPPPHEVTLECRCADLDTCATASLAAHRDQGWKEYFRVVDLLLAARRELRVIYAEYAGSDPT